ncbi:hypothetical protein HY227_01665 [Candidatus Wolfebacteria bacterium]|nr:hypothetical protein [Candidatus Wolfebacteria bacterium]
MDQFNLNTIEKDIGRISKEMLEKKNLPEHKDLTERELIRQTLGPLLKQSEGGSGGQPQGTVLSDDAVLPSYLDDSSPEIKHEVERLVEMAFNKGIDAAVSEARKSNAFILDALHDALTDKVYKELKDRGML